MCIRDSNHNFAVDPDSINANEVELTHVDLNDQTLEGLRHRTLPLFSVQYHPEAAPGPVSYTHLDVYKRQVNVQRLVALRRAHIMQHRSGRNRRRRVIAQPIAFQRAHIQLTLDQGHGKLPRPHPVLDARPRRNPLQLRG